jgi:hypothetical protein
MSTARSWIAPTAAMLLAALLPPPVVAQDAAQPAPPTLTYTNASGTTNGVVRAGEAFTLLVNRASTGTTHNLTLGKESTGLVVLDSAYQTTLGTEMSQVCPTWSDTSITPDAAGKATLQMRALMAGTAQLVIGSQSVAVRIEPADIKAEPEGPVFVWKDAPVTLKVTMPPGVRLPVRITSTNGLVTNLAVDGPMQFLPRDGVITLAWPKAGGNVPAETTFTANVGGRDLRWSVYAMPWSGLIDALDSKSISINSDESANITLKQWPHGQAIYVEDNDYVTVVISEQGKLTVTRRKPTPEAGPITLTIKAGGKEADIAVKVLQYQVTVTPESLALLEGETKTLKVDLIDQYNGKWPGYGQRSPLMATPDAVTCRLTEAAGSWEATVTGNTDTDKGSIAIGAADPKVTYIRGAAVSVKVAAKASDLELTRQDVLIKGSSALATLRFKGRAGVIKPPVEPPVVSVTPDGAIGVERVADQPGTASGITYRLTGLVTGDVVLTFTLKQAGGETLSRSFVVAVREVSGFTKVGVRLQMMDDATAEKAFGEVARRDYYIMQVAMFNRLDPSGPDLGKSILAFSDTIEMKVFLEKRSQNKPPSGGFDKRTWRPVTEEDVEKKGVSSGPEPFQTTLTMRPQAATVTPSDAASGLATPATASVSAGGSGILTLKANERRSLIIRFADKDGKVVSNATTELTIAKAGSCCCKLQMLGSSCTLQAANQTSAECVHALEITCTANNRAYIATLPVVVQASNQEKSYAFKYRPYLFDLMVNTFEARDYESTRASGFRLLDLGTTIASFLGAVRPSQAENLSRVNDSVTNLMVPALRRLLPDQKDTQRQNTMSMLMRPMEEVAYGTTLSRVLFFPKRSFSGYIRGYDTRIAAVDTGFFEVDVAVVDKRQKQDGDKTGN